MEYLRDHGVWPDQPCPGIDADWSGDYLPLLWNGHRDRVDVEGP